MPKIGNAASLTVCAGTNAFGSGKTVVGVIRIFEHEGFRLFPYKINEIGILKLQRNLVYSETVRGIQLPVPGFAVPHGSMASITGWGAINSNGVQNPTSLRTLQTPIIGNTQCTTLNNFDIRTSQLCAGYVVGRDACTRKFFISMLFNNSMVFYFNSFFT